MAKIKYDVTGVESGGNFKVPKPGVYKCKIQSITDAKPEDKDRRLEIVLEITEGDFKGSRVWDYVNLESEAAAWKLRQFLEAVGLVTDKKQKGMLDVDALVDEELTIRVKADTWEGNPTAKVAAMLPADADADDDDDEDLDDDDDEDDGDGDDDDDGEEDADYSEMSASDLKEELEERELDLDEVLGKGKKRKKGAAAKKAMVAALEEDDGEEDEDYSEMDVEDLRSECKERGLPTKGSKKVLVGRLEKDDESDEDPF